MLKYILQRLGFAVVTLFVIIVIVYLSVAIFSNNPFVERAQNSSQGGEGSASVGSQVYIDTMRRYFNQSVNYHLTPDVPFDTKNPTFWFNLKVNPFVRLFYWFKDIFNKDHPFGLPYNEDVFTKYFDMNDPNKTIPALFFKFLKFSIIVTLPAFVISASLGIVLGVIAGYKRGKFFDVSVNFFSLVFVALPSFVLVPIFISVLLSFNVPPQAYNFTDKTVLDTNSIGNIILSWLPPIFIIVLGSLSGYITFTRNQVVTVLTSNYILIAKSKGLGKFEIFTKYVLRNISIPLATAIIPSYIGLLSGGIIIETYWQIPGTSQTFAQAFPNGEINIIMFSNVLFTALGLFTELLVDVVYTFLDPRIKYASPSRYSVKSLLTAKWSREAQFRELLKANNSQEGTLTND
ncbi:ABC transporter permease [Mycoplasma corogypsi]|uniref:ABC transporter permease n=1 Tax=Mycoplasma corogypsi TaxID=2106 RepID=UPI0038739713